MSLGRDLSSVVYMHSRGVGWELFVTATGRADDAEEALPTGTHSLPGM